MLHWQKTQQIAGNTTSKLNHIRFLNDSVCIIAGGEHFDNAVVLRSVDGGFTFAPYSYPEAGKGMYGMGVSPQGKIFLSGTDGCVLHSIDTGRTFQFNRILDWDYYVGVSYPTPDTGFFVSTHLNDAGSITRVDAQYHIIDKLNLNFGLADIFMVSPTTGYVIGYGAVMKTTDGGLNWIYLDPADDKFVSMDIHGDELWMCGYAGTVYHSTDAGVHWQKLRNGNDITLPRYRMLSIVFKDSKNGWISCDDGKVVYTDDGGHHWMEYDQFTTIAMRSIVICPNNDLMVAGDNGMIYRLTTK